MSYKLNTYDESILSYEMSSYLSNSFVKIENDDLNFDKVIKHCEAINYESSQDVYKKFNNIRDSLCSYDSDKHIIEQTL